MKEALKITCIALVVGSIVTIAIYLLAGVEIDFFGMVIVALLCVILGNQNRRK